MSGFSLIELQRALARSLNGRCVQTGSGVLAKDGAKPAVHPPEDRRF